MKAGKFWVVEYKVGRVIDWQVSIQDYGWYRVFPKRSEALRAAREARSWVRGTSWRYRVVPYTSESR